MNMNKTKIFLTVAAAALCVAAAAQNTAEEFQARYERLVRNVGYSGVGVETLLDRWEEAFPEDMAVPTARFNYYFDKACRTEMVAKPGLRRYLGNEPILKLKDPEGNDVPYFEENFYDEEIFGEAMKVVDQKIAEQPDELRWRFLKVTGLAAYEKESPDMAAAELRKLIARNASARPAWTLDGAPADAETFQQGVGEYCAQFFRTGSTACYEYFREISELMNKQFPKNPVFIDNIGSYWQAARNNDKQAIKYYKKALKLDPDDFAAKRNMQLIERRQAAAKKK
ncbi:MAG: hypothetical protein J6W98_05810 [Bacteroidales bacterium]|nr:hypothetical protein [Bacteroidales bacterium]